MVQINADRLVSDLRRLASFGKCGSGVDRIAFSEPDLEARRWLRSRFDEAGIAARMDGVGNVYGEYPNVARALIIGSHSDTVPMGGWLDGALGVIYGLEIARAFLESGGKPKIGIDVLSFQDEEGTFLPCFGSRSFCEDLRDSEIDGARSKDGRGLAAALASMNSEGALIRRDPGRHVAYLEAHIEQGPRLEAARRKIGVVTTIVGIRRFKIQASGQADHAGTTPMAMRRDAGAALFDLAHWVAVEFPRLGGEETVWNIGSVALKPGAANVVPSEGELTLEFRDPSADRLDRLEETLAAWVSAANARGGASLALARTACVEPRQMTNSLREAFAASARDLGEEPLFLTSGAGHDAMVLSQFMPAGMLFVPSISGRSHDVTEDTSEADIIFGCQVLAATAARLAEV